LYVALSGATQTYRSASTRPPTKDPNAKRARTLGNYYNCGELGHFVNNYSKPCLCPIKAVEEGEDFKDALEELNLADFWTGKGDA
jgi:hypothetical protein